MTGATIGLIVLVIILVAIYLYFRHRAKNQALEKMYGHVPSHVELYFEEYFDEIIDNWDLVDRKRAEGWATDMEGRLNRVTGQITTLKKRKKMIDSDLDKVEDRIEKMESSWRKEVE